MKYEYIFRHLKIIKLISLLILTLFLYSCGGGGGGASGGGTSYTVSNCTDSGTAYQTYEYYIMSLSDIMYFVKNQFDLYFLFLFLPF